MLQLTFWEPGGLPSFFFLLMLGNNSSVVSRGLPSFTEACLVIFSEIFGGAGARLRFLSQRIVCATFVLPLWAAPYSTGIPRITERSTHHQKVIFFQDLDKREKLGHSNHHTGLSIAEKKMIFKEISHIS
jgi:hypothetical protein